MKNTKLLKKVEYRIEFKDPTTNKIVNTSDKKYGFMFILFKHETKSSLKIWLKKAKEDREMKKYLNERELVLVGTKTTTEEVIC